MELLTVKPRVSGGIKPGDVALLKTKSGGHFVAKVKKMDGDSIIGRVINSDPRDFVGEGARITFHRRNVCADALIAARLLSGKPF